MPDASKNDDQSAIAKGRSVLRAATELYNKCRLAFGLCPTARIHTCYQHRPGGRYIVSCILQNKCKDSAAEHLIIAGHSRRTSPPSPAAADHLPPLPAPPPARPQSATPARRLRRGEQQEVVAQHQRRPEPAAVVVEVERAGIRELAEEPVRDGPRDQLHQEPLVAGSRRRRRLLLLRGRAAAHDLRRRRHCACADRQIII